MSSSASCLRTSRPIKTRRNRAYFGSGTVGIAVGGLGMADGQVVGCMTLKQGCGGGPASFVPASDDGAPASGGGAVPEPDVGVVAVDVIGGVSPASLGGTVPASSTAGGGGPASVAPGEPASAVELTSVVGAADFLSSAFFGSQPVPRPTLASVERTKTVRRRRIAARSKSSSLLTTPSDSNTRGGSTAAATRDRRAQLQILRHEGWRG